jgi:hypothetical protein
MGKTVLNTQCYRKLTYFQAVENCDLFDGAPSKGFIIGGTSTGANMAAALAHRAKDDPFFRNTPLTGQVLQVPVLVHPDMHPEQSVFHLFPVSVRSQQHGRYKSELLSMSMVENTEMAISTPDMVYDIYSAIHSLMILSSSNL